MDVKHHEKSGLSASEYEFLRNEIRHEDGLMGQRITWLVSSQSFLLTGFAILLNGPSQARSPIYDHLREVLVTLMPIAGLAVCAVCLLAILGGLIHMGRVRKLAGRHHPNHFPEVQGSVLTRALGLSGPTLIPMIFIGVWITLLVKQ
jgi:hypothetical protein